MTKGRVALPFGCDGGNDSLTDLGEKNPKEVSACGAASRAPGVAAERFPLLVNLI